MNAFDLGPIFASWYQILEEDTECSSQQAHQNNTLIGAIIAKLENHRSSMRGYIAMLAVQAEFRGQGIGIPLVRKSTLIF